MKEDRKEYLKNYRLTHKEQYRKYSKKYRENNLTTYERLKKENEQLRLILGNQVRIKDDLLERINKAIEYIEKDTCYDSEHTYYDVDVEDILTILEILKGGDVNE